MNSHSFEPFQQPATHSAQALRQELKQHLHTRLGQCMASAQPGDFNCMKLAHYLSVYSELFSRFLARPVKILEIGVQHGGSLRLWQNYFGADLLEWTGIDINPECKALNQVQEKKEIKYLLAAKMILSFSIAWPKSEALLTSLLMTAVT